MHGLPQRLLIGLLSLVALAASLAAYVDEREARVPTEAALSRFGLDVRRPEEVAALRVQPAADLRASFLADMTLSDVYRPVSMARLSAEERGRWLLSLTTLDAQLAEARELSLDALARRPGWAFHHAFVGELEYVALRRASIEAAAAGVVRWERPLMSGVDLAPGNLGFASYLAGAYIETWGGAELEGDPVATIRRALKSPAFVNRNYRIVDLILGDGKAIDLLPDDPRILRIAFARERADGRIDAAATLRSRMDTAEREGRSRDLAAIRERARLRDEWGQRAAAAEWLARYRLEELDDTTARREAADVLSLWPGTKRGPWLRDPRATLVRYFLSGRERSVDGATLASAVELLSDVPEPVRARALALAGRTWEAEQLVASATTAGSFEWTPVIVDLVEEHLKQGRRERAVETLGKLAPAARNECNVLLLRRGIEESGNEAGRLLDAISGQPLATSRAGALSLCVDPVRHADARLVVSLSSPSPALVSYGWDGGRLGSIVVDGEGRIEVPLSGLSGRHPFRVASEAGPKVEIVAARVEGQVPASGASVSVLP